MQEDVIAALRSGRLAEALSLAEAQVLATPQDPQLHRLLSVAQAMSGDIVAAHASLDRALALAPDDASLHYQRATLLVGERRQEDARTALAQSVALDPNELRAYLLRAQLALWDRDPDQAEQQLQMAARLQPDHPGLLTLRGLVLLQRRRPQEASAFLVQAVRAAPEDPQARYTLGLSFLAQGHAAFAEQAFARVLEQMPGAHAVRRLLADAIRLQGREAEAAGILEAGLALDPDPPTDLLRQAGELRLAAGEVDRALDLLKRGAMAAPDDRRLLDMLIEGLRRKGDAQDARRTLDAAIAAAPHIDGLWSARLSFEPGDGDLDGIAARWESAIPGSLPALQLKMWLAERDGDLDAARDYAERILTKDRSHFEANVRIIHALYLADPPAAVAHIESLLPDIRDNHTLRMVLGWLGRAQDRAGCHAEAVVTWAKIHVIGDRTAIDLPMPSGDATIWAPATSSPVSGPVFVFGAPGSGVERIIGTLNMSLPRRLRMDRLEGTPPADLLQAPDCAHRLAMGMLEPMAVTASWRAALPGRQAEEATIIDWLPAWDHALLRVLRDGIPDASLLMVLSDPRDMLLDWLQRGAFLRYRVDTHLAIAQWLAAVLEQVAMVLETNAMPHRVIRLDAIADDAAALAREAGAVLDAPLAPLPALGPGRFPAGHWRRYTEALAEPFALLAPVAARLGYPEG